MQLLVQVVCSRGPSLRERIADDKRLEKYGLTVTREKTPGRAKGWMKVHSTDGVRPGAINVEWDGRTQVLICRVINRGQGRPNLIVGDFIAYLFARHRKRIQAVNLIPR